MVMHSRRIIAIGLAAITAAMAAAGCDQRDKRIGELQREVAALVTDKAALARQVAIEKRRADQGEDQLAEINKLPPDRWKLIPRIERIEIGRYSGLRPGSPQLSGSPATQPAASGREPLPGGKAAGVFVRLYVIATDADGFRIRPAGAIRISFFDLSAAQPRSLSVHDWDAEPAMRNYRSALGTEFFAFDLPLLAEAPKGGVTARVELTDWLTGKKLVAEKLLTLPQD